MLALWYRYQGGEVHMTAHGDEAATEAIAMFHEAGCELEWLAKQESEPKEEP